MYHNNESGQQYDNNEAARHFNRNCNNTPSSSMFGTNFMLGEAGGEVLQTTGESDDDSCSTSGSSGTSSSSLHKPIIPPTVPPNTPCSDCLQLRCICSETNGFDPAILQLQLPQLALLMQHGNNDHLPASTTSFSFSPKPTTDFNSTNSPFICQFCEEWFVLQDKLVLHLVVNHSMVYCKFCTRLFRSQSEHTVCAAHQGTFPCQVCHSHFHTDSSTTGHELAHHQVTAHDMHTCPFCGLASRPKDAFLDHIKKKHECNDNVENTLHLEGIISEISNDNWSFHCKLCKKQLPKNELFTHFHSYHHLSLTCLIELLHCGHVFIPISGYNSTFPSANNTNLTNNSITSSTPSSIQLSSVVNMPSATNNSGIVNNYQDNFHCNVCSKPFSDQVPKIAHDVFCVGMAYCQYCALSFSSGLAKELHVVREHSSLPCIACGEHFPAETSLRAHYARTHNAVLCYCCDSLVPVTPGGLENHLTTRHDCTLPTNMTTLCQVGTLLACNLCLSANKFTTAADDLSNIFIHLCQNHFMTPNKALNLLCRPSVHGIGSFGPPSDKIIKDENVALNQNHELPPPVPFDWENKSMIHKDEEDDGTENILVPQVNLNASSDNETSADEAPSSDEMAQDLGEISDLNEDAPQRFSDYGEPDVDPEDVDCVTDSSDDEGVLSPTSQNFICEMCPEKSFVSARDVCAHLFSIHKMHWDKKSLLESDSQYQCERCGLKLADKVELSRHKTVVHGGESNLGTRCRFCSQRFTQAEARNQHQLQLHADRQRAFYRCHLCQFLVSSTAVLSQHMLLSHSSEAVQTNGVHLKCRVCLLLFPTLADIRSHFRATHPAAMVFCCRYCSAHLKTRKTLKHHVKVVHCEARRRDCAACGKVLWSKKAYAIHFRMKHSKTSKIGFRCRICQQRFDTKEQRKLHYTIDHEGESPYHCVDCGKGFASKSGMYGHRQLHTGSGISKCEYCGKEFTRKDSYNEHLLIHNGPRHKCPHCPKEFVQRSNLVRHIRIHTGEKPYQCTFCEKRFSDKGACNSHIRVHTREETCSCPYCGQTFSKKQKLKYHIRKHTGEGLIECEICNKMFTNSFALKEHRVIHNRQTQVVCPQCGKGFNSEKYLQRHVAIVHEPSNAFSCPLCPKTFSQQARLKAHVMTHSGVKHIKCLLCDKAYSVRKSLRRHLLEKHEVSPEHPQYKHCFHAMSPEEAGLGLNSTAVVPGSATTSSTTSTGRKRRRVEQIVQSLQRQAAPTPLPDTSSRVSPLLITVTRNKNKGRGPVKSQHRRKRRRKPSSSEEEEEEDRANETEGLNLTVVKPEDSEDPEVSSDS